VDDPSVSTSTLLTVPATVAVTEMLWLLEIAPTGCAPNCAWAQVAASRSTMTHAMP
jgi:hypothetical protein